MEWDSSRLALGERTVARRSSLADSRNPSVDCKKGGETEAEEERTKNLQMVYGEHTTTHDHHNPVVDVHDSFLLKFWRNRIHHGPVGLVDSKIVWKDEMERIRYSP